MSVNRNIRRVLRGIYNIAPFGIRTTINEIRQFKTYPWAKEELRRNQIFKNQYKGRCFIIGNGPSLSSLDFSLLANEYTFTFNQLARNPGFHDLQTNFHFWSDDKFYNIDENKPEDVELLNIMKSVDSEKNHPAVFFTLPARNMIKKFHLDEVMDIHYYSNQGIRIQDNVKHELTPYHAMPAMSTTVQYAICFAVYMGFTQIYLLGCDCSGFINVAQSKLNAAEKSYYAYTITENEKKRMEKTANKLTMKQELYAAADIFEKYEYLYKYCKARNVQLFNATDGGLLDALPRVNIDLVLKNK